MRRVGQLALALGAALGLVWLVLHQSGTLRHWAGQWIDACAARLNAQAQIGDCIDCASHGCGSQASFWFGGLPVLLLSALLIGGGMTFVLGRLRRG